MYEPQYDDNYNEWVELYNNEAESVDLSNYTLCGVLLLQGFVERSSESVRGESGLTLAPGAYAIITDGGSGTDVYDNYDVNPESLAIHVDAGTLCQRLSNSGKTITLSYENLTIDEITYTDDAESGFSLEYRGDEFLQSANIDGTPGRENSAGSSHNESEDDPPQNDSSDDDSQDEGDKKSKSKETPPEPAPSFVPLSSDSSIQPPATTSEPKEKKKITLSSTNKDILRDEASETYLTSEGKIRQTVIYAFAGFCIALTFLIVLKKV